MTAQGNYLSRLACIMKYDSSTQWQISLAFFKATGMEICISIQYL